jgi:hypothetical protein
MAGEVLPEDIKPSHHGTLEVLKRQLALHARLKLAGKIRHDALFFKENGEPIRSLNYPWRN